MGTGDDSCGRVKGAVQIGFARSVSPVTPSYNLITRLARTTEERMESGDTEYGVKWTIPYALYRAEGCVSATIANRFTGMSEADRELLWEAILNMFTEDVSAVRGKMCLRKLIVFHHDSDLGRCAPHLLFDRVKIQLRDPSVEYPRVYEDYLVTIDRDDLPDGVTILEKV